MLRFGDENTVLGARAPFVEFLEEDGVNRLTLLVAAAAAGPVGSGAAIAADSALREMLDSAQVVIPDDRAMWEITFDHYILFQVRGENYCSRLTGSWQGRWLLLYNQSPLLDAIPALTDCRQLSDGSWWPGLWRHYGIVAQNHVIDIVSTIPPVIRPYGDAV